MKSATKAQVQVYSKIEDLRGQVMGEMVTKIEAFEALKNSAAGVEQEEALRKLHESIGELEDRNKELSDESSEIWAMVSAADGEELVNPAILSELEILKEAYNWLERISRRLSAELRVTLDSEDLRGALESLAGARTQMCHRQGELGSEHRRYQLKRAYELAGIKNADSKPGVTP
jgi:hypothetical protein